MSKVSYNVRVTKVIEVTFETEYLTTEFWSDFNSSISDRGGPDTYYLAEHAAWNYVQGEDDFIEGIGDLKKMGVELREIDSELDVEEAGE